jgi:hypothetical protein
VGREGGGLEEGGQSLEEEGGHKGHAGLMVRWGPRVLHECSDIEEVVFQGLSLQALVFIFCFIYV